MTVFSRGIGLRVPLLPRTLAQRPLHPISRFTTSTTLRYAKPAPKKSPIPNTTSPSTTTAAIPKAKPHAPATAQHQQLLQATNPAAARLLQAIVNKGTPTLLYESGSHFWMKLSTWGAATMFYGYAVINYGIFRDFVAERADQLGPWVTWAFIAACVATTGFGSYFFRASHNIVKNMRALPTAKIPPGSLPRGVDPKTTPVLIEINIKRILPGLSKKVVVPPHQVVIPYRVFQPLSPFRSTQDMKAAKKREQAEKKAARDYDRDHLMTVPIRHAGRGMKSAWFGMQRALTKTGFMRMGAGGMKLKLDVASGWALDEGRAIDSLVTVENRK
ncbi:hypothetical protein CKAH01_01428 [Colletotrichum kahawae]|uniref:Uncharacterized protein n=1 Tax=Colletotrichum kahawae TaxID=34407 RepID=A0AAD9Y7M7_COLKA|nr:hypothetical protein CKAH01_01428 [Colletotrichum kahawae]